MAVDERTPEHNTGAALPTRDAAPAVPPREPLDAEQAIAVRIQCEALAQFARSVDGVALDELITQSSRYDTIMPVIDPTQWIEGNRANHRLGRLLRAVRDFRRALDDVDQ